MNLDFSIGDKVYTTSDNFEEVNNYSSLQFITSDYFNKLNLLKCIINEPLEIVGIGITYYETVYNLEVFNKNNNKEYKTIVRKHIFKTKVEVIDFVKNTLNKKIDNLIKELENKKLVLA